MKKWIRNILWCGFLIGVVALMAFINKKQETKIVGLPEIYIEVFEHMLFLTKDQVYERLSYKNLIGKDRQYNQLEIEEIEREIQNMPEVRTVDVYVYVSGKWMIDIDLRKPIARIFNQDSTSFYLDQDGKLMPLSNSYTARVMTINGFVNETDLTKNAIGIMNNDSLKTIEILDDLYAISSYVCSDEFLSAQITHVFVNQFNEFELIPRVGDQRILFGDASFMEGKFKKLEGFYTQGINRYGWENLDTINLMFNGGLVYTSKR